MRNLELNSRGYWKYGHKTPNEGGGIDVVELEISYRLGGSNVWHGTQEKRGIEADISIYEIKDGFKKFALYGGPLRGGLRFFVLEQKRKNARKIEEVAELFDPIAQEVTALWHKDHEKAVQIMRETVEKVKAALTCRPSNYILSSKESMPELSSVSSTIS